MSPFSLFKALDQAISRPDALQDGISPSGSTTPGTVLEGYTYLALNTIVQESHPQTGIDLTYISLSGDTSAPPAYAATGGDRYVGLDQVGRVDDQFYVNPSSVTSPTDRFQYSYDQDNNVLYKDVVEMGTTAATYSQLYHASGGLDSAAFDGQDRETNFEQGTLSHTNSGNGSVLDTVASSTQTQALTLDSLGNWDASATTGGTLANETRTFNAQNQITLNSGSTTPTYDHDGNTTEDDAGITYTYTAWSQLARTTAGGHQYAFTYLPNGPQASVALACCGGTSTFSFYSTDWQDLEDVPPGTPVTGSVTTYVWGLENVNELVARDDGSGNRLYAQHDANMDVTALVNTSGSVVERFSYTPSGVVTVLSPSWSATTDGYNWTFLWQGGRYNAADGLYTFDYRDYSPTLGTWMEEDPTGYAAGPNVYQAMLGAPIEKRDPYGLATGPAGTGSTSGSTQDEGSGGSDPSSGQSNPFGLGGGTDTPFTTKFGPLESPFSSPGSETAAPVPATQPGVEITNPGSLFPEPLYNPKPSGPQSPPPTASTQPAPGPTLRVTGTTGTVQVSHDGGATWSPLSVGDTLDPGDAVRTGYQSSASFTNDNGTQSSLPRLSAGQSDGSSVINSTDLSKYQNTNFSIETGGPEHETTIIPGGPTLGIRG